MDGASSRPLASLRPVCPPRYHVLVDTRDRPGAQTCYVCHDNIEVWFPVGFDEDMRRGPIRHPEVPGRAFYGWNKQRGNYIIDDAFISTVEDLSPMYSR